MITFTAEKQGKLIKLALKNCADISYSAINKLLRDKDVKVNGKRIKDDVLLEIGDRVEIYYTAPKTEKFSVVFKDEYIIVVDKKAGYLSETVFDELSAIGKTFFIHRLDRNTAGIMVFARTEKAEKELIKGFKTRAFIKYYTAVVIGRPPEKEGVLEAYLIKDSATATVRISDKFSVGAVKIKTGYKVIENNGETSVLQVRLFTGKTHQIRAHLAYIDCPIVGDGKYGDNAFNKAHGAKELQLFSESITFHFDKGAYLYYLDGKTFTRRKGE